MMKTYRLVAEDIDDGGGPFNQATVCVDVILRSASKTSLERVEKFVVNFLDAQSFVGTWVDEGTERTTEVTLARTDVISAAKLQNTPCRIVPLAFLNEDIKGRTAMRMGYNGSDRMNFTKASAEEINGTGLQGYAETSYEALVRAFGEPDRLDDGKVRVEWQLKFPDGTIATIYDWKEYRIPVEQVKIWNIGGKNQDAVRWVQNVLPEAVFS